MLGRTIIGIYTKVDWKVHRLTKILSWNVTKWSLFFDLVLHWSGRPGFHPRSCHTKTLKMVLDTSLLKLSNIRCISRVKWSNPGKGVAPSSTPRCSSYWKGSLLVALDYGRQLNFLSPSWGPHISSICVAELGPHWLKSHQQEIWPHHINFSSHPHTC